MTADRPATEPRAMREALDELADAFPVDEISDAPWIVERGSIAWIIRESENGPQVGNFILEADARWVAAARNAIEVEAAQEAAPLACNNPRHDEIEAWYRQALELAAPRAEGLDVERLEQALANLDLPATRLSSRAIRDEYARLSRPSDEREGEPDDR